MKNENSLLFYYATSEAHIKLAAQNGIPNVVVDSRQGKQHGKITGCSDDQLCLIQARSKLIQSIYDGTFDNLFWFG